jgi:hypothetical protein
LEELGHTPTRVDADLCVGIGEPGILRGYEKIALHGKLEPTGDGIAVDSPYDGFIAGSKDIRHVFPVAPWIKEIILADDTKIDAGAKRLAIAGKDRNFYIAIARHFIDRIVQVYQQVLTDGIVPFRSVQGNQRKLAFYFKQYGFIHDVTPFSRDIGAICSSFRYKPFLQIRVGVF